MAAVDPSKERATGSERRNSARVTVKVTFRRRRWSPGGKRISSRTPASGKKISTVKRFDDRRAGISVMSDRSARGPLPDSPRQQVSDDEDRADKEREGVRPYYAGLHPPEAVSRAADRRRDPVDEPVDDRRVERLPQPDRPVDDP